MPTSHPSWLQSAIIYQIYPAAFQDSNGDGIGDINGIHSRLDYLQQLGVNLIWLCPAFASPFRDGGYDIEDFYQVDPRYGTNDDLVTLFESASSRGIRIILDLVAGHTSDQHIWFRNAVASEHHPDADRYIWKSRQFSREEGPTTDHYEPNFFEFQPALNFGYATVTEVWQDPPNAMGPRKNIASLIDIMAYWMQKGAAGFRVDMASSLVKNDKDYRATSAIWREVRNWFEREYPQCVLLAEWSDPEKSIAAGFHADFLLHFHCDIYRSLFFNETGTLTYPDGDCYFDRKGTGSPWIFLDTYMEQLSKVGDKGFISIPSSSHDFQRLHCGSRTLDQLPVAWVFLMTQKGLPAIFQGDEIGMRFLTDAPVKEGSTLSGVVAPNAGGDGERSGSRTPMQWDNSPNCGFSTAKPQDLYLPVDSSPIRPTVLDQLNRDSSLLALVRRLIQLRKDLVELGVQGTYEVLNAREENYPLVIRRRFEMHRSIIVVNPSSSRVHVKLNSTNTNYEMKLAEGVSIQSQQDAVRITAEPFGYLIAREESN